MKKEIILVLGPQGSGKSTQAKLLADYLDYKFISTGELVRRESKNGTELAKKIQFYQLKGELVPDDIIEKMLFDEMNKSEHFGFLIDGFPRNKNQLKDFLEFLKINDYSLVKVFYLDVSLNECLNRIKLRREIENRPDESEEAVKKRLDIYFSETAPLLEAYKDLGVLVRIDGERTIEEIQDELQDIMNEYLEEVRRNNYE